MYVEFAAAILLSCLISACFTFWVSRRSNKIAAETIQKKGEDLLEVVREHLETEFAQFRPLISRAMSIAGNAGQVAKKVQAFEREAIKAVQDDLPITPDMIRSFSPKLGEMIDENPELLFKGREVLMKILGQDGNTANTTSKPHPFGLNEE